MMVIVVVTAISVGGWVVPRHTLGSRVSTFHGPDQDFASYAVRSARELVGGSLEPLIITAIRVQRIELRPRQSIRCDGEASANVDLAEYRAIVTLNTWWGLPYKRLAITCEDVQTI